MQAVASLLVFAWNGGGALDRLLRDRKRLNLPAGTLNTFLNLCLSLRLSPSISLHPQSCCCVSRCFAMVLQHSNRKQSGGQSCSSSPALPQRMRPLNILSGRVKMSLNASESASCEGARCQEFCCLAFCGAAIHSSTHTSTLSNHIQRNCNEECFKQCIAAVICGTSVSAKYSHGHRLVIMPQYIPLVINALSIFKVSAPVFPSDCSSMPSVLGLGI